VIIEVEDSIYLFSVELAKVECFNKISWK